MRDILTSILDQIKKSVSDYFFSANPSKINYFSSKIELKVSGYLQKRTQVLLKNLLASSWLMLINLR